MKALTEKITLTQLFLLIVSYQLGTAMIVGLGKEAKQDAWIAFIFATVMGIVIIRWYLYLLFLYPGKDLYQLIEIAYGRKLGMLFSFLYVSYFLHSMAFVIRDFGELIVVIVFPNTPIEVIVLTFTLVLAYFAYMGIEVTARSVEIFIPYAFFFLFLMVLFLGINGSIQLEQLRPVLENGIIPVLTTAYPALTTFPMGETIPFMLILPVTVGFIHTKKVAVWAVMCSGILLSGLTALRISVLGVEQSERAAFPFISAIRNIAIANFIERLDALVVFVLLLGVFVKASIYLLAALKGLEYLSRIPYRRFSIPITMLVSMLSVFLAANYAEYKQEIGTINQILWDLPYQQGLPLFLTIVLIWKHRRQKKKGGDTHGQSG